MSQDVIVQFEVRSMLIMKDTLAEMGFNYKELNNGSLRIDRQYHNIIINGKTGNISYDEEDKSIVDDFTQKYMVSWYKDKAIREGNTVREEVKANGEIHLHVTR